MTEGRSAELLLGMVDMLQAGIFQCTVDGKLGNFVGKGQESTPAGLLNIPNLKARLIGDKVVSRWEISTCSNSNENSHNITVLISRPGYGS